MSEWQHRWGVHSPYNGEEIFIRESYIDKSGEKRISYRSIMYFDRLGFNHYEKMYEYLKDYRITHWMRIPKVD